MRTKILNFIKENELSPFNQERKEIKADFSIFKTRDARQICKKTLNFLSRNFIFSDTYNILKFFNFEPNLEKIKERQNYFRLLSKKMENQFLKNLTKLKKNWKPKYQSIVATENEATLIELKRLNIPCHFIIDEKDISLLKDYDLIQALDCENSKTILERLPQTIFLNSIDEAYLERYIEFLFSWKDHLILLNSNETNNEIKNLVDEILPLLDLLNDEFSGGITEEDIEKALIKINEEITENIKKITVSGEELISMLKKNSFSDEINQIIRAAISKSNLPFSLFNFSLPVTLDEKEVELLLKSQSTNEFVNLSEKIKKMAKKLSSLPEKFKELEQQLILFDFEAAISKFIADYREFPLISEELFIKESRNLFLENPEPISFFLNSENRCSILTGANSGGKTTLLEHIIQLITLFFLGLPVSGSASLPIFSSVYYFAKNKGSPSKGAFENLLTQMAEIKLSEKEKTLIVADEIEAVTEPGAAGKIICASVEYFLDKDCYMIIATHLGQEIKDILPKKTRIDGIEATGLNENNELILSHNPIIGKLARSTPELIIERLANLNKNEYYSFLNKYMKR